MKKSHFVLIAIAFVALYPSLTKAMTTLDVVEQYKLFKYGDPVSPSVLGASASGSVSSIPTPKPEFSAEEKKILLKGLKYASGSSNIVKGSLKEGDTGDSVNKLQLFLSTGGHLKVDPTGKFGPKTKEAVMKFQKAKGLKPDGKVGPVTNKKISEEVEASTTEVKQ